jgi:hypothetical protein
MTPLDRWAALEPLLDQLLDLDQDTRRVRSPAAQKAV